MNTRHVLFETLQHLRAAKQSIPSDAGATAANHALDDFDDDLARCIEKVSAAITALDVAADVERAEAQIVRSAA